MARLHDPEEASQAQRQLQAAAQALQDLDADGGLGSAADAAAEALDALAGATIEDEAATDTATDTVGEALERLGEEAQQRCDFPVG